MLLRSIILSSNVGLIRQIKWLEKETSVKVITEPVESKISNVLFGFQLNIENIHLYHLFFLLYVES